MGSTFVETERVVSDKKSWPFDSRPDSFYMQFVPGIVGQVVTNLQSPGCNGNSRKINSILAKPHYSVDIKKLSMLTERDRYYPLFRGIVDVPVSGDQVLLTTIGGAQFYIGPINTVNSPNWNIDLLHTREHKQRNGRTGDYAVPATDRQIKGLSRNFRLMPELSRVQKLFNTDLDDPNEVDQVAKDISGDMLLEGRHGNSIRIGSRNVNPYIIISNGRNPQSITEGSQDGSVFGMFDNGSLRQHFPFDLKPSKSDPEMFEPYVWQLSCDEHEKQPTRMADLASIFMPEKTADDIIYNYGNTKTDIETVNANQALLHSNRITINAKTDSVFISAFQNIHIGAGNSLTLSANQNIIVDAEKTYLGKSQHQIDNSDEKDNLQGLVMGENLRKTLLDLVEVLMSANGYDYGTPIALGTNMTSIAQASSGQEGSLKHALDGIRNKLTKGSNDFVSKKHFIELN